MQYKDMVNEEVYVDQEEIKTLKATKQFSVYCRAVGRGVGLFLMMWGVFSPSRWDFSYPNLTLAQAFFYLLYGMLLILPVEAIKESKRFKWVYILFVLFTVFFVFSQIFDTIFQYHLAEQLHTKNPMPAFQSMLVFFTLLQVPAILIHRNPRLLH